MKKSGMKPLVKYKYLLYTINEAKPKLRKAILKNSPNSLVKLISEICYNVLKGNCNINKHTMDQLKKHKKHLRVLASPSSNLNVKRARLIQTGGSFLPLLLIPLLADLFNT